MIRKRKILILFLIIFIGLFEINLIGTFSDDAVSATAVVARPVNNIRVDEQAVQSKFMEIRDIPYNQKSMNCKTKSEMLANYLLDIGATGVYLVTIQHDSDKYSHEFVEWNGVIYDTCNKNQLSYKVSKNEYLNSLHKIGFNGLMIQSPYVYHDT